MNIEVQASAAIQPMPTRDYFSLRPHVSQSMLKDFAERRRLYEGYYVTGNITRPKPTASMELGTAIHAACLEPDREIVVEIPPDLLSHGAIRTNECKAWIEDAKADGLMPMKDAEIGVVRRAKSAFMSAAKSLLEMKNSRVMIEHAVMWTHDETSMPCKAKPDWVVERKNQAYVLDLKTCPDASPKAFAKSMANFGYGIQRAHYRAGVTAALGGKPCEFYFVAVETCEPFAAAVYHADGPGFDRFEDRRHELLRDLADCVVRGDFREPWEGVVNEIDLPHWAFNERD
jgi:hypothetical protein